MPAMKKIVCTTDFSEVANHAIPYALRMAKTFDAELILLHAVTLYEHDPNNPGHRFPSLDSYCTELRKAADANMQVCIDRAGGPGVAIRKKVVQGVTPHAAIVEFVKGEGDVAMIVMSTHGRSGLGHVLLGSVAENVIRYAPCPVLVVKRPEHEFVDPKTGEVHLGKILFPIDLVSESLEPIDLLRLVAEKHGSEIVVYHAVDVDIPPIYYTAGIDSMLQIDPELHERVEKRMRALVGDKLAGLSARYVVEDGRAAKLIKEFAREEEIDLVVMSSQGAHGIGEYFFGSTAARVIQKAVCPVLVV